MLVKYAGFNLYGQCTNSPHLIIDNFIEFHPENVTDLVFTHATCVSLIENEIIITGVDNEDSEGPGYGKGRDPKVLCFPEGFKVKQMSASETKVLFLDEDGSLFKLDLDRTGGVERVPEFIVVEGENINAEGENINAEGENINAEDENINAKGENINAEDENINAEGENINAEGENTNGEGENTNVEGQNMKAENEVENVKDNNRDIKNKDNGERMEGETLVKKPRMCDKIIKVACGHKISVALTESGRILNIPNCLSFDARTIKDVCVGREHCLLLDGDGNFYSFGAGSRGQLGHSTLEDEEEPRLVEALAGIKIKQIAAGGWHSCALSEEGDLYVWGWNSHGQMGLDKQNVKATPTVVDIKVEVAEDKRCLSDLQISEVPGERSGGVEVLAGSSKNNLPAACGTNVEGEQSEEVSQANIIRVACGSKHTVMILDNGSLYGMGWNKYSQLTKHNGEKEESILQPRKIFDLKDSCVYDIKCGPWSTCLLWK